MQLLLTDTVPDCLGVCDKLVAKNNFRVVIVEGSNLESANLSKLCDKTNMQNVDRCSIKYT